MRIIKLNAIDSTNAYLKSLVKSAPFVSDFLTVWTPVQTAGVGQRGAKWESEPYKNLTFSILRKNKRSEIDSLFVLNMVVSIAVINYLKKIKIPDVQIKWPNDIMSHRKKIGGILIENTFSEGKLKYSVIGIGLNINQTHFKNLEKASSLKLLTEKEFSIELILKNLIQEITHRFQEEKKVDDLINIYEANLFQKDKVSVFRSQEGSDFSGIIRGVQPSGKLRVELENEQFMYFDLKEVQLLF